MTWGNHRCQRNFLKSTGGEWSAAGARIRQLCRAYVDILYTARDEQLKPAPTHLGGQKIAAYFNRGVAASFLFVRNFACSSGLSRQNDSKIVLIASLVLFSVCLLANASNCFASVFFRRAWIFIVCMVD